MNKVYSKKIRLLARNLRGRGWTIGEISLKMRVPKNTLSGWFKDIQLTQKQKERIRQKISDSAAIGRPLALKANREKLEKWKQGIRSKVKYLEKLPLENPEIGKLVCGILYLCEGARYPSSRYLYFGNSNPIMVSAFLSLLRNHYHIDENKLRFDIGYRWDQDYEKLKKFWSKVTGIPESKCLKSKPDLRTKGKPTLKKDYMGVGRVVYFSTDLQFELQSIGELIVSSIVKERVMEPEGIEPSASSMPWKRSPR